MSRKVIPMFLTLILVVSFYGCGRYDAPKSSKTFDIKSFRIENGKKIRIEPIFSKTVFEYENEPEDKIEFVEWKPKPLLAKGELEQFWVEYFKNYPKASYESTSNICLRAISTPEGWHVSDGELSYLFNPVDKAKEDYQAFPYIFDMNSNLCIGRYEGNDNNNSFACWDRINGHLKWEKKMEFPWPVIYDNSIYLYYATGIGTFTLGNLNIKDGRSRITLKNLKEYTIHESFPLLSTNIMWIRGRYYDKNQVKDSVIKFNIKENIAYLIDTPGIEGDFVYNDTYYYYNNKLEIYEVDPNTMGLNLFFSMFDYLPDKIPLRESILSVVDGDLLGIKNYKKHIILNMRTKKVFEPEDKIGYNRYFIYLKGYRSAWGIDPVTFEKTWSIKIPSTDRDPEVLIIDEMGILIKGDDHLFGFRPKK